MANFSWKNHVSVLRISLNSCRSSENKLQGTQQTNEQIATVLKMLFNKMQARFLKTNLFISFASKFFENCFSITCFLRPVCAIIRRNYLKKNKIFFFQLLSNLEWEKNWTRRKFFFFSISSEPWSKKTVNGNKLSAQLSKLYFPCPKEQFEKDI